MIVLASTSPWRAALLRDAGIHVTLAEPAVDESAIGGTDPGAVARARAVAKAQAVAHRWTALPAGGRCIVVGADQVVHLDGRRFDKPTSEEDQVSMLRDLRGRRHALTTAVCLHEVSAGVERARVRSFGVTSHLTMRPDLDDREIRAYAASGEGRGCAGGYQVEARGILLFSRIEGDWTNIVGLPLPRLVTELRRWGWRPGESEVAGA